MALVPSVWSCLGLSKEGRVMGVEGKVSFVKVGFKVCGQAKGDRAQGSFKAWVSLWACSYGQMEFLGSWAPRLL